MTVSLHHGAWRYDFIHGGVRYRQGGFDLKRTASTEESKHRERLGDALPSATMEYAADRFSRETTVSRDKARTLRVFMLHVRNASVASITREHIEGFSRARRAKVRGSSVNRDLAHLSSFFSWCERRGWCRSNPARGVTRYPEPIPTRVVFTHEERVQFFKMFSKREQAQVELLYLISVRKSVVLGMQWEQIDWDHQLLTYRSKGKDRTIPLSSRAVEILRGLGPKTRGPVFDVKSDTTLRRAWSKVCRTMGVTGLRRHDLRVMFARDAHSAGADLVTIRELLGHSTITMTTRYVPALLPEMRAAVEKVGSHPQVTPTPRKSLKVEAPKP